MFQTFAVTSSPETGPPRLARLRDALRERGLDGFLVPRADAHQGEYVAPRDARLSWLTGFTGSAGAAAVLAEEAAVFVDGRYRLQVRSQVDGKTFQFEDLPGTQPADWLAARMSDGQRLGYDPWLHVRRDIEALERTLGPVGVDLVALDNPIDAIWTDQPAPPVGRIQPYPIAYAGKSHADKIADLAQDLVAQDVAAQVLTLPDSISWLLNIRGSDIERNPVAHGFAILRQDATVEFFVDPAKYTAELAEHLGNQVTLAPIEALDAALAELSGTIGLDPATAPVRIARHLIDAGKDISWRPDPCLLPKACKTDAELAGTREAHLRDGAAMAEFLCWLDQEGPKGNLTEIDVVRELEARRAATRALKDISFETICGAGPDGAIVHYRVTDATDRPVRPGELLLVDSGGQYLDGTTDITRTMAIGQAPEEARRPYTLVLKGMIAISRARWPKGLAGRDLDALARAALWQAGFDYDHGTGHGVGAYLSVHEGPQNLSRRGTQVLLPGMILSNEPGYYREGAFGIRIENLVAVLPEAVPKGGDRPMLGFETLTFAPIDISLIDASLLTSAERDWLNSYHLAVRTNLTPRVSSDTARWLTQATRAI